jgi:hypothetical protein
MKKYIIWLTTEYKRAACKLPLTVKRAVIVAIGFLTIACMIAFCTSNFFEKNDAQTAKLKVGYVADDNMITNLALSYVEDMESVKSICSIEKAESENKGLEQLENGELSALVVLPENVIDEINSGRNAHGKLYLPAKDTDIDTGSGLGNVAVMLFEELSHAGMGMLGTAQAEIYATETILSQKSSQLDSELLNSMYGDIDRFNLTAVSQRGELFNDKSLSLTGNDTYAVYYASALFTIYIMLVGLFFGEYCKRSYIEQLIAKRRIGVGFSYQLLCRYVAGVMLATVTVILPIALLYIPPIKEVININLSSKGIIAVLLATIFMTVFNMLIFELAENRQAAVVMTGFNAILQSYMAGCIIPTILLPVKIAGIGEYLPASFIKKAFRILITGRKDDLKTVAMGLIIWSFIIFIATLIAIKIKENAQPKSEKKIKLRYNGKYHIPSLPMVVLRRFLNKKSIWVCLIIIAVLSALIVRTEKKSDTNITVAFYDESGEYTKLLEEYEGLVSFVSYESEDEVKLAVLKDEAECGYIIPEKLTELMLSQMSNGSVIVYQDDDAVAVPIVNEVIFERIFKNVSLKWYENYISENEIIKESGIDQKNLIKMIDKVFDEKLNAGITFDIDIEHIGEEIKPENSEDEPQATYPVFAVAILIVAICGIYGIIQAVSDIRTKRFYRCRKIFIYALTVLIPVLFGAITGFIIIVIIGSIPIDFLGYK